MLKKGKRRTQLSEINVVPYIDVMLVLLVIFMITAPLLSQGVKVNLPKASAQTLSAKMPEPIIVSVDAQGNYYLNISANPALPINANELASEVAANIKAEQNSVEHRQVLVKGDQSVNYGKVVQVMVILQQSGAESVGLMTQEDNETKIKH